MTEMLFGVLAGFFAVAGYALGYARGWTVAQRDLDELRAHNDRNRRDLEIIRRDIRAARGGY